MSRFSINCPIDVPSTHMGQGIGYIKDLQLVIPAIRGCMGLHDARVVVILFWAMYMYHGTLIRGQRQLAL